MQLHRKNYYQEKKFQDKEGRKSRNLLGPVIQFSGENHSSVRVRKVEDGRRKGFGVFWQTKVQDGIVQMVNRVLECLEPIQHCGSRRGGKGRNIRKEEKN